VHRRARPRRSWPGRGRAAPSPQPAPWHGTFDWNETRPAAGAASWHAYPLTEADTLFHPDDPPQIARAGYLRQRPPARTEPDEDSQR